MRSGGDDFCCEEGTCKMLSALKKLSGKGHRASRLYDPEFFAGQQSGSKRSAEAIVPILMDAINPRSVVDVGCGVGTWSGEFLSHGASVVALDGDYVPREDLRIPPHMFSAIDLNALPPASEIGEFDLALCLEVAEHLRPESAEQLIRFLTDAAQCVLFSAAIPGQRGRGHINEQWQSYWVNLFEQRGYHCNDIVRPKVWNLPNVQPWYAQNVFLFTRHALAEAAQGMPIDVVHPDIFHRNHKDKEMRRAAGKRTRGARIAGR